MAAIKCGGALIYGIRPIKPIINIPPDATKVRVRLRNTDMGKAFVKYPDRIEQWALKPSNDVLNAETWELWVLQAVNGGAR